MAYILLRNYGIDIELHNKEEERLSEWHCNLNLKKKKKFE